MESDAFKKFAERRFREAQSRMVHSKAGIGISVEDLVLRNRASEGLKRWFSEDIFSAHARNMPSSRSQAMSSRMIPAPMPTDINLDDFQIDSDHQELFASAILHAAKVSATKEKINPDKPLTEIPVNSDWT